MLGILLVVIRCNDKPYLFNLNMSYHVQCEDGPGAWANAPRYGDTSTF